MSTGNWQAAYCETLHAYIMDVFHDYRREAKNNEIDVRLNGGELANIIAKAKLRLYKEFPEAREAGHEVFEESPAATQEIYEIKLAIEDDEKAYLPKAIRPCKKCGIKHANSWCH